MPLPKSNKPADYSAGTHDPSVNKKVLLKNSLNILASPQCEDAKFPPGNESHRISHSDFANSELNSLCGSERIYEILIV